MSIYPDIGYPAAGDIAEPGTYSCLNCPHDNSKEDKAIVILNQKEQLPVCPVCGGPYWFKS